MILELCVYRCLPGRLPALMNRFESSTLDLFAKHGFTPHGFFTTMVGRSAQELTYMLLWDSLDQREKCWHSFHHDPDWIAARTASEADGMIVVNASNQLLQPTPFSPLR
ncbi:NIPSNAP family protein [Allosediminivita pacifica]|uniref:NIPSNAP protein n=1 Tax=Allosediminivita pacifica TaxID=1267769 RepID=A0A2T6A7N2_9RHOB|nr:NIPSNAP family protein [Allosediminivita pacifica]PTX39796.1 NIPSNAP protein [Allosediminivita pacifica]GGB27226.1 NIPSNAP family protein [Allosediminivita pacifica]